MTLIFNNYYYMYKLLYNNNNILLDKKQLSSISNLFKIISEKDETEQKEIEEIKLTESFANDNTMNALCKFVCYQTNPTNNIINDIDMIDYPVESNDFNEVIHSNSTNSEYVFYSILLNDLYINKELHNFYKLCDFLQIDIPIHLIALFYATKFRGKTKSELLKLDDIKELMQYV